MSGDNNIRRGMEQQDEQDFDPQADNAEFYDEGLDGDALDEPTEDWEAYDSEFGGEEGNEESGSGRKKNSTLTLMLIGGAVLVGCFIFWTMFLNKPAVRQQGAAQTAAQTQDPAGIDPNAPTVPAISETVQDASNVQNAPKGGLLNDDKQLNSLAEHISSGTESAPHNAPDNGQQPPMPAPMASAQPDAQSPPSDSGALTPMPSASNGDMTEMMPETDAPAPPPITANPPANDSSAPFMKADTQGSPAPNPPQDMAQPSAPQTAPTSQANDALEAKMDALLDRIGALENKLANLPSQNNIQSLIHSVDEIESRLNKLEKTSPQMGVSSDDVNGQVDMSEPVARPVAAPRKATTPVKTVAAPAPQKSAARWVLKSAQPGLAYVSQAGRDDMVTVRVGEMLPGIGRVNNIAIINGRWTVSGSDGSISQ